MCPRVWAGCFVGVCSPGQAASNNYIFIGHLLPKNEQHFNHIVEALQSVGLYVPELPVAAGGGRGWGRCRGQVRDMGNISESEADIELLLEMCLSNKQFSIICVTYGPTKEEKWFVIQYKRNFGAANEQVTFQHWKITNLKQTNK